MLREKEYVPTFLRVEKDWIKTGCCITFNMHFKLVLIMFESKVQDLITPKIMDMSPPEPATSVHLDIESGRPRGVFLLFNGLLVVFGQDIFWVQFMQ